MTSNAPVRFEVEFGVRSDVTKDTMSVTVKLAQELDESHDIGQSTAECQLIWPSRRKLVIWSPCSCRLEQKAPMSVSGVDGAAFQRRLVTWREYLLVQGGAEDTVERVLALRVKHFLEP